MKINNLSARIQGSAVLWMVFLLLLATAAGVILFLPQYIEENQAEELMADEGRSGLATGSELRRDEPGRKHYKKQAEVYREQFLKTKGMLEAKGVDVWGGVDVEKILDQVGRADALLQMRQEKNAAAAYEWVLDELERLQVSKNQRLKTAVLSGENALEEGNGDEAHSQFKLALSIEPENSRAIKGMKRAELMEKVSSLLQSGNKKEESGQLNDALEDYKKAELLDRENKKAQKLREKIERVVVDMKFNKAMSRGFSALKMKKYSKARKAFLAARDIKPHAIEAADALKLTDSEYKNLQINEYKQKAAFFENEEKWLEAEKTYKAALDLDPSLDFAIEGKKRSDFFLKLNNEMDYMINHPGRLSSDEPYNKALKLLEKADGQQPKGPELKKKITRAEKILAAARIALPVTLESDGQTDIVVYKIGNLGRFARLILNLYPGTYIAIGSCPGYQDIKKEFAVTAGASPEAIYIRCEEPI